MPAIFAYALAAPPITTPAGATASAAVRPYAGAQRQPYLGFGLATPLTRNGLGDFTSASGRALVRGSVRQILGTRATLGAAIGELPWRTAFGSVLGNLTHRSNTETLGARVKIAVLKALKRWEPRVEVTSVSVTRRHSRAGDVGGEDVLEVHVRYRLVESNVPGTRVVLSQEDAVSVDFPMAA